MSNNKFKLAFCQLRTEPEIEETLAKTEKMLREAAFDAGRDVRLLETLMQSRDHPASLLADQALYLKGYILQIF